MPELDYFEDRMQQVADRVGQTRQSLETFDFFNDQSMLREEAVKRGNLGAGTAMKVGLSSNPEMDLQIVAKAAYPNLPIEEARQRVSTVDGRPVFLDENGEMRWADSGITNRAAGFVGEAAPAAIGGIVGSIIGTPILGGGLGAAAGEGVRRVATGALLGEAEPTEDFARAVAFEGATDMAFGKLFQFAGTKIAGARARGAKLDDLDPEVLADAQRRIFDRTGIQVDLAQLTGRASLANLRDWASRFPNEAADLMRAMTQLQSDQSQMAAQTIMDMVIKQGDRTTLGRGVRNAADAAIQTAKMHRRALTRPYYEAAFNSGGTVDVTDIVGNLDSMIADAKGPIKRALVSARSLFNTTVEALDEAGETVTEEVLDTSVRGLHNTQRALQSIIDGAGDTNLSAEIRGLLSTIRGDLVSTLNESSELYQAATRKYAEESARLVDPLTNGVVGTLAQLKDQGAARAGALLLTGRSVTPEQVRVARTAIQGQSEEAWNGAVRLFLDDAFEKAATETQGANVRNFAGKFRQAVFGSPRQRAVMREAMGDDVLPLFEDVMSAFEQVSNLPIVGSNTARDMLITQQNEGALVSTVRFLRQAGVNILDRAGQVNAGRYAIAVSNAMTDPAKVGQLKELRRLPESAARSALILGVVFGNMVSEERPLDTGQQETP